MYIPLSSHGKPSLHCGAKSCAVRRIKDLYYNTLQRPFFLVVCSADERLVDELDC